MRAYSPSRLSDAELRRSLVSVVAKERTATATVVAHIAEFDARRLYLPEGYPSMREYCVGELHYSEDAAYKRIQAARAARKFPAILGALAEGRLHLSAVCLLAPHLTPENAGELLAAATHRSKVQVERLIAEWFPQLDVPVQVLAMAPALPGASQGQLAPGQVETPVRPSVESSAPGRVRARVTPIAPERFHLQVTIDRETQETCSATRSPPGIWPRFSSALSGPWSGSSSGASSPRPTARAGADAPAPTRATFRRA